MFINNKYTPGRMFGSLIDHENSFFNAGLRACDRNNGVSNCVTFRGVSVPIDFRNDPEAADKLGRARYTLRYAAQRLLDDFYRAISRDASSILYRPGGRIRSSTSLFIITGMSFFVNFPFNTRLNERVTPTTGSNSFGWRARTFFRPYKSVVSHTLLHERLTH